MSIKRAAGLVIFRKINEVVEFLFLQTSYGEHHWTPPKGHVDEGENEWETALRETEEEAGLKKEDLEIYKDVCHTLKYLVNGSPKTVIYWLAQLKNPEQPIKLSDEHQDLRWAQLCDAEQLAGFEDMKKLLNEIYKSPPINGSDRFTCVKETSPKVGGADNKKSPATSAPKD